MAKKANSLAHTKWMCKYHIVFTPKYRRKVIYNQLREDIGEILSDSNVIMSQCIQVDNVPIGTLSTCRVKL